MGSPNRNTVPDQAFLEQVRAWPHHPVLHNLDAQVLRHITRDHGIDFATALLYDRIVHDVKHRPFIERVRQLQNTPRPDRRVAATVAIIPGAFYREYPQSGADGRTILQAAANEGCHVEIIPTASTGRPADNARVICRWLESVRHDPIVLVSLSKGGADLKLALNTSGMSQSLDRVKAWINIGGILRGSPMVNWNMARPWCRVLHRSLFLFRGRDFQFALDLERRAGGPLDIPLHLPEHLQLIHVAGFPLRRHLVTRYARRWHRRLADLGPNDSVMMLDDLLNLPGMILPIWGVDHYLHERWHVDMLVSALLRYILDPAVSLSRSTDHLPSHADAIPFATQAAP